MGLGVSFKIHHKKLFTFIYELFLLTPYKQGLFFVGQVSNLAVGCGANPAWNEVEHL